VADREARLAQLTPEGGTSLRVRQRETGLEPQLWGAGSDWLRPRLPALLGLLDRPDLFQPPADPLRRLWRRFPGVHLPRLPTVFTRVVQVVLLQRVERGDALRAWQRLVRQLGSEAPGPMGLRLPPTPERLARAPSHELVALGIAPRQAQTLRSVARQARRIEAAADRGASALREVLGQVTGVGPWTREYVVGSALGEPDVLVPGDLHLPHTVAWALAGEERGSELRMRELLEPYRGHRYRVIRLLWLGGVRAPRHGPRRRPARHSA